MAKLIDLTPTKTYKTRENAIKAVTAKIPENTHVNQCYFIAQHTDGRYFPVFVGERAIQAGLHFHFNIIG